MKKILTAGGVVIRKKDGIIEVVLIKDSYGRWAFPKGHIEKGEGQRKAALREVQEEIGCKNPKIIKYLGEIGYWSREGDGGTRIRKAAHYYLMELSAEEECVPQKEEGITEIIWVRPEKALKMSEYRNNDSILKKAIDIIKNTP